MAISLANVVKTQQIGPPRIVLYAPHGIGKTTFGASMPKPIFILGEDGLGVIQAPHFPLVTSTKDVLESIAALCTEEHDYGTVILDTADWIDNVLLEEMANEYTSKELSYGKDAQIAADKWRRILDGLNMLRNDRNMTVVLLAHCAIKRFDSPEVEPFDRYQPKLHGRSSALLQEWADIVLFANMKTLIRKDDVGFDRKVTRGTTTGERVMYTQERPAYYAKNRYMLPAEMPFSWPALAAGITAAVVSQMPPAVETQ